MFNLRNIFIFIFCSATLQALYSQPSNDNYTNPIILTQLDNSCSGYAQYTNVDATADAFSGPACWSSNPEHDVWFKFTAIATAVNISIFGNGSNGGTLSYPCLALCSIDAGSNLSYVGAACNEASYFPGFTSIYTAGLVIGNSYYIRVDGAYGYTGTFKLCINNFTPSIHPGQDCDKAAYLCNKNTVTQVALNGCGADCFEGSGTCLDITRYNYPPGTPSENNSAWYIFTISEAGILTFSINPNNNLDDIDFALFQITGGDCTTKQVVRCSAARCINDSNVVGPTGLNMSSTDTTEGAGCGWPYNLSMSNWVEYLNVNVGDSYALLINNCSDIEPGTDNGFTLSFGGSCGFAGPIANFVYNTPSFCLINNAFTFTDSSKFAATYDWKFGDGASIDSANTAGPFNIHYSTPGLKTVVQTVTGKGGCEVVKVVNFTIFPEVPQILVKDTSICDNANLSLFEGNAKSYVWSNGSSSNIFKINAVNSAAYYVTVTDTNGCSIYDTLNINIKPAPNPVPTYNSPVCDGDTLKLFTPSFNNAICSWHGPDNFKSAMQNPFILNALSVNDGNYFVSLISDGCLSDTAEINVNVYKNPVVYLVKDTTICSMSITLHVDKSYSAYLWQDHSDRPFLDINGIGTFWVKITDKNGCTVTDTANVRFGCNPVIYCPNAFSPSENLNNKFVVYGKYVTKYNIKIYNRWGALLYNSDDLDSGWDGKYNNSWVPGGVYPVIISYEGYDVNKVVKLTKIFDITVIR